MKSMYCSLQKSISCLAIKVYGKLFLIMFNSFFRISSVDRVMPEELSPFSLPQLYFQSEAKVAYSNQQQPPLQQNSLECLNGKEIIKTTDLADLIFNETEQKEQTVRKFLQKGQFQFDGNLKKKVLNIQKGSKDDTMLLNINFKTILVTYFREKIFLRELNPIQICQVQQFVKRQPSFKSLSTFCREGVIGSTIRYLLIELVESGLLVQKILESRCMLSTKMQMFKFMSVFHKNIVKGQVIRWKDFLNK